MKTYFLASAALALCAGSAFAQIDGSNIPADAGTNGLSLLAVQNSPTQFGNSTAGTQDSPGGSELNAAWGTISGNQLRFSMTGNLEGNFNKMWIFFDGVAGGEQTLQNDNVDGGFNEINNMAGMRFDDGFEPERGIRFEVGGGFLGIRGFDLVANTGGDIWTAGGTGDLPLVNAVGGQGVTVGWNNANGMGVSDSGVAGALGATMGWELVIDMPTFFGSSASSVKVMAFISNGGGDFLSNQFLAPVGSTANLGGPSGVDLRQFPGDQFMTIVPAPGAMALLGLSGLVALRRKR